MFVFCGCATTEMVVKENADGSIELYTFVDMSLTKLQEENIITAEDVIKLKSAVETNASEVLARVKAEFRYNISDAYKKNKISSDEKNTLFSSLEIYTGWDNNVYAVKLIFKSKKAYDVYTKFGENVSVKYEVEERFWVTKYSQKFQNPLGRKREIFLGGSAFEYFVIKSNSYMKENFTAEQISQFPEFKMYYTYMSNNKRLHSDAEVVDKSLEGTVHTWEINKNNYQKEIEFYSLSANKVVWYLLALDFVFFVLSIYLASIYFLNKK